MESISLVQILGAAVWISLHDNALETDMNPSFLKLYRVD